MRSLRSSLGIIFVQGTSGGTTRESHRDLSLRRFRRNRVCRVSSSSGHPLKRNITINCFRKQTSNKINWLYDTTKDSIWKLHTKWVEEVYLHGQESVWFKASDSSGTRWCPWTEKVQAVGSAEPGLLLTSFWTERRVRCQYKTEHFKHIPDSLVMWVNTYLHPDVRITPHSFKLRAQRDSSLHLAATLCFVSAALCCPPHMSHDTLSTLAPNPSWIFDHRTEKHTEQY